MGYTLVLDTSQVPTIQSDQVAVTGWAVAAEAQMWADSLIRTGADLRVQGLVPELLPQDVVQLLWTRPGRT